MRSRPILFAALAALTAAAALRADTIGVKAVATSEFNTNGIYGGSGCGDATYPSCSATQTNTGLTSASAMESLTGTVGPGGNPVGTTSDSFASVSVSEGHVSLSFSANAEGIGEAEGSGGAAWNDVVYVGGGLAAGTPVTLDMTLGITAEFLGLQSGNAEVQACFTAPVSLCTSGGQSGGFDGFTGYVESPLILPATVHQQIAATAGSSIIVAGNASGDAEAAWADWVTPASWQMLATNSAHFSIVPLTSGVVLSTESGCSITSGYGCDPVPSATPEPASLILLASGLLAAFVFRLRQGARDGGQA